MGGLWVDYDLHEQPPRSVRARRGELLRPRRQPARCVSALMQGLADGYFVLPATIGDYLAPLLGEKPVPDRRPGVHASRSRPSTSRCAGCSSIKGTKSVDHFHRELGKVVWDNCGMARSRAEPREGAGGDPRDPRGVLRRTCACSARDEIAQPVAREGRPRRDFLEFGELLCLDALHRKESCGGHFREEYQTEEGEALRDDENFAYVARVGVHRRRQRAGSSTRNRSSSSTSTSRPAATSKPRPRARSWT